MLNENSFIFSAVINENEEEKKKIKYTLATFTHIERTFMIPLISMFFGLNYDGRSGNSLQNVWVMTSHKSEKWQWVKYANIDCSHNSSFVC